MFVVWVPVFWPVGQGISILKNDIKHKFFADLVHRPTYNLKMFNTISDRFFLRIYWLKTVHCRLVNDEY